jgi:transposase-like protein
MSLTSEQIAKYLSQRGVRCLYCGADAVEGGAVEIDDGEARQRVGCGACNETWTDVYTLTKAETD